MNPEEIMGINEEVFAQLWDMVNVNGVPIELSPKVVFPKRRDGSIRFSEQEARVLFCGVLNPMEYFYSIETPTEEIYSFTENGGFQSASSDLSLYSTTVRL